MVKKSYKIIHYKDLLRRIPSTIERPSVSAFIKDLALALAFPILIYIANYYFNFLIWIAFTPIIILAYEKEFKSFLVYSSISLLVVSLSVTLWVRTFSLAYCLIAFLSVFIALFISFSSLNLLYRKIKYPTAMLLLPIVWYVNEFVSGRVPGGNIWFDTGVIQPMLFPLTFMIGEKGITFLMMLVNSCIAGYFILREKKYLAVIFVLSPLLLLCFYYSDTTLPTGKKIKVAVIQGNIHSDWEWRIKNHDNIFNTYRRLSLEASKSKPDIIVWPEYAIPEDMTTNKDLYTDMVRLAKETRAYIVFGSLEKTERTDKKYQYIKDVAHIFTRNGDHLGTYASVRPFPFEGNIIPGTDYPVFHTEIGKFGIIICWEEYSGEINKKYAGLGADFFIHIVNDAPVKDWNTIKTRVRRARFRASENNRYVIRAANSGITEVINPYGKVTAHLEPNKEGFLISDIYIP